MTHTIPVSARSSTVLGYDVTADSALWKSLRWNGKWFGRGVQVDHGSIGNWFMAIENCEYLHVPSINDSVDEQDCQVRYRVRPKEEPGKRIRLRGKYWRIVKVEAVKNGKRWCWKRSLEKWP